MLVEEEVDGEGGGGTADDIEEMKGRGGGRAMEGKRRE